MEDLNKNQIILLVLLISFVTSIATGIMTTSLLQEAPLEVTRNINRIVEKTIETVTIPGVTTPGQKEITTVIVKEEDMIVSSIDKNIKSIVRINEKDSVTGLISFYGLGLVINKDGIIAADRKVTTIGNTYMVKMSDGKKFEEIDVERENDEGNFIAFEDSAITPSQLTCGEKAVLTTNVYNIGDEDQDQVKVTLFDSDLGVNTFFEIRNDLDQGDKEEVTFNFAIPQNLKDGIYYMSLWAEYDYNRGSYREKSEEETKVPVTISGCSAATTQPSGKPASITAVLGSDAAAGKELVVDATITNLKSKSTSFVVSGLEYEDWATLSDISERIITLDAGESKEITFRFDVNNDVSGEQSFVVEARTGDNEAVTREVAVNIAGRTGGITGFASFGEGNSLIWIIGIINVVLIVLIIIVAVRISRR